MSHVFPVSKGIFLSGSEANMSGLLRNQTISTKKQLDEEEEEEEKEIVLNPNID